MMDRKEAIQVLQTALTAPFIYGAYANALKMAIESLSAEPSGDLISRKEAIKAVQNHISDNDYGDDGDIGMDAGLELAVDVIKALPSADMRKEKKDEL